MNHDDLQRRHRQLRERLRALTHEPLMRGSLVNRLRRCGRPNCACATDPAARHGGKFLTVHLEGKTQAVHVRPADEPYIRAALASYQELWDLVNALTGCELAELRRKVRERRHQRQRQRQAP
jgi:hypothetical protein